MMRSGARFMCPSLASRIINQLQLKALRAAVPVAADDSAWAERIRRIAKAGSEVLKAVRRAFGALDELALLVAPQFLRRRIVVLDDIERKHPKLSVDEILGFIYELTQQHDARFVLILNDDKLDKAAKDAWATLRDRKRHSETLPPEPPAPLLLAAL